MAIKVWDGSKWAMASQIKVWDGSSWREPLDANVHIWTGSAWQKVHPGVALDQSNGYTLLSSDPTAGGPPNNGNAGVAINLFANGKIQTTKSDSLTGTTLLSSNDWLLTGTNSDYDVFVNNFSGSPLTISSPTDGTRSQLSTDRVFRLEMDYDGSESATFDLIICANNSSGIGSNVEIQNAAVSFSITVGSPTP